MEIEMIQGQKQKWVPIVDGVLLHSSVDPEKEAKVFVDSFWDRVSNVRHVVLMGLGGGYHLRELHKRGKKHIFVVEANAALAKAVLEKSPELADLATIVTGVDEASMADHPDLQKAVSQSYSVVYHPPSVSLNPGFYQAVSDHLSQRTLKRLRDLTKNNEKLNRFLNSMDLTDHQVITLPMMEQAMKRNGSVMEREGLIWMTLRELVV